MGSYKYMMITSAILDLLFSALFIVACPVSSERFHADQGTSCPSIETFAAMEKLSSLLIVKGGIPLPMSWARLTLIFFIFLLCQSIVTPPCLFVFRYLQICKTKFLAQHYRSLRYLLILPLFISSSSCALMCFAAWPTQFDLAYFQGIAMKIHVQRNATFLVAMLKNEKGFDSPFNIVQSKTMLITSIYLIIMMVSALSIMLYCTKRIMIAARAGSNEKTRKLQMQLYKTLIAQVE
ncbi:hypothetical protein RB195_002869 [Necator americanus]